MGKSLYAITLISFIICQSIRICLPIFCNFSVSVPLSSHPQLPLPFYPLISYNDL